MKKFLKGLLTGAAIGGALGVLFAPKSGKETRQDIKDFYNKSRQEILKRAKKFKKLSQEQYNKIVKAVVEEGGKTLKIAGRDLTKLKKDLIAEYNEIKKKLK